MHGQVFPVTTAQAPRRGQALGTVPAIVDGAIAVEDGLIREVGTTPELLERYPDGDELVDAQGCAVIPGFIDCHTHLPFAAWRADEYRSRLEGQRYEDIAKTKGGIARSSDQLRQTPDEQVLRFARTLAEEMRGTGTTTLEMKSGYGLTVEAELRQLRLIAQLRLQLAQRVVATGLFLHAVPLGVSRQAWIRTVTEELLPLACAEGLVGAVDAFVERAAFSVDEVRPLIDEAVRRQLLIRLHTDQFTRMGGTGLGIGAGARGIDHLDYLAEEDILRLAASDSVAVLLPAATYSMNQAVRPPARRLIEAGGAIALATDFNPGTAPISSMPLAISLAVHLFGLTPEEALSAVTINAAYVLGLDQEIGSLEPGKHADLLILDSDRLEMIPYRAGHNPVARVMIGGEWMPASPAC